MIVQLNRQRKHSKKCTFYTLRFGCSFAAVNTIKPIIMNDRIEEFRIRWQ